MSLVDTMRCFVALDLAADVIEELRGLQGELRKGLGDTTRIKWVSPASMHLTLKFLGDKVDVGVTPALEEALVNATRRRPAFDLQVKGIGAFPRADKARVIWAGLDAPPDLEELWEAVQLRLEDIGFARDERALSPHVTLGRVKDRQAKPDLSELLSPFEDRDLGPTPVQSVVLYRSTLTPKGPRYEALARAQLKRSNPTSPAENGR